MLDLSKINIGPQKKKKTQEGERKKTPIKKAIIICENF